MSKAVKENNPFTPASLVSKKLKVLVYGESGSGKTWFALSFPGRIAVIDTEGGSELYGGRSDVQEFDVLRTKSYEEVMGALEFIERDAGKTYQTVVVDPLTVVWQVLQEAAQIKNERRVKEGKLKDPSLTYRDWGVVKARVNRLYVRLTNLPVHVVVIARNKDVFQKQGDDMVKIGDKPDSEKSTPYHFDVILRMVHDKQGFYAVVEKDRSSVLPASVDSITYAALDPIAARYENGEPVQAVSETDAAEEEAAQMGAEDDASERAQPVNAKAPFKRPMAPEALCEFIKKRVAEEVKLHDDWAELGSEGMAQDLAILWRTTLRQNDDVRHTVASSMLGDEVVTFKELSIAEITVLTRWITYDSKSANAEADGMVSMLLEAGVLKPEPPPSESGAEEATA